jgi:hypothetical protein
VCERCEEQVHPVLEKISWSSCSPSYSDIWVLVFPVVFVRGLWVGTVSIGPEHTPPGGQDERKVWHICVCIYIYIYIYIYICTYISSWNRLPLDQVLLTETAWLLQHL